MAGRTRGIYEQVVTAELAAELQRLGDGLVRAEGACSFAFPLPNSPSIAGFQIDMQAAFIDNSVPSRAVPVTFTNGVHMIVQ